MSASPKLLRSLSRSMTPTESGRGMGRRKSFSESPLGFDRLLEYARRKQRFSDGSLLQSLCSSGRHGNQHWWHWLLMQAPYSKLQTISLLHVCSLSSSSKITLLSFHNLTWFLQLKSGEYFKIWATLLKSTPDPNKQSLVWNHKRASTSTIIQGHTIYFKEGWLYQTKAHLIYTTISSGKNTEGIWHPTIHFCKHRTSSGPPILDNVLKPCTVKESG